jgi:hypothetical protein
MPDTLVERMRGRLEAGYWPRVHCLLLVGLASAAAFLGVLRRTAFAALVIIFSATMAGYALQRIAPEARSIGGVWQHLVHHE